MPIELSDETRARLREAIQRYFHDHLEQDVGILQTDRLLEFVVASIGATVYNQAIADAHAWLASKLLDIEGDLHATVEWGA